MPSSYRDGYRDALAFALTVIANADTLDEAETVLEHQREQRRQSF